MGGNKGGNQIKPPDYAKEYKRGLDVYLKYLPKELRTEFENRAEWDPRFMEQALAFQHAYDPQLAQEQRDALARRDPQWLALHEGLGAKIQEALQRGYLDPRQEAAYQRMSELAGRGEPLRDKAYQALGTQVTGDTLRGPTASPALRKQMEQAILSRSPTLSSGAAQDMAAAVYTGLRGQQLQQQRQQATGQFLQTATPTQQREASLSGFYGQAPPSLQTLGLAGTYIQPSNSLVNAENAIGAAQAPRTFGYVNPNAPLYGVQQANNAFGMQLAAQQYNQGGGGGNPWMSALQGAAQGSQYGSVGGGYGAAGGALTGGILGAFGYPQYSDARLKTNISRTGLETKDGIPIVDYDYNGHRWRGVLAQEVLTVKPEAVFCFPGGALGVFYDRIGIKVRELQQNAQEGA